MKSNDAYIYLGHAARNALALGIHRAQVVDGDNLAMHRVRIAFWTIYVYERSCSLFSGRPSSFRDEMIDAPYPSDIPNTISSEQSTTHQHLQPTYRCAWIRSMSQLGKISDRIFVEIYSCQAMVTPHDILKVRQSTISCDSELQAITHTLPTYLHFFDPSTPIGEGWQEVQRIMMGVHYYIVRMLLHRQALVFTTLFDSQSDAEDCSSGIMQISDSIEISVQSAESLINLAHDVFFHRHPSMKFDGSVATLLVSACITLLFYLLGHKFNPEDVRKKFAIVEKGIRCLDQLQHIGPTSGKAISQDIMKVAKDAYLSIENQPSDLLPFQYVILTAISLDSRTNFCDNLGCLTCKLQRERISPSWNLSSLPQMLTTCLTGLKQAFSKRKSPIVSFSSIAFCLDIALAKRLQGGCGEQMEASN